MLIIIIIMMMMMVTILKMTMMTNKKWWCCLIIRKILKNTKNDNDWREGLTIMEAMETRRTRSWRRSWSWSCQMCSWMWDDTDTWHVKKARRLIFFFRVNIIDPAEKYICKAQKICKLGTVSKNTVRKIQSGKIQLGKIQ